MVVEYAILDLYHLFVEVIFGHFLLALIGIAAIFALICFLTRMSLFVTLWIILLFLMIMFSGYYGSVVAVFIFFFSSLYFAFAIIRWIQGYLA